MSKDLQSFTATLTRSGYRITTQRIAIFKLLISPKPLAPKDILNLASAQNIDRVSVYRNIDLFEKLGIVHRIYTGWKYKLELSDDFMNHHHHLSCLSCGTVIDIQDEKHIEVFINEVAKRAGFTPRRHTFEVDGYCLSCTK